MPTAPSNGIEVFYDTLGARTDPALVLIRGLGSQMIAWREPFCEMLAEKGFFVVRFDNRDVGLTTKTDLRYAIDDMAGDTVGLMDHLKIAQAHICGMSMGGMIAQQIAISYPHRVLSLTSIMSTIGGAGVVQATSEAMQALMTPAPDGREAAIAASVESRRVIGSPKFFDEDEALELATLSYDRCNYPEGRARQMRAIQHAPGRADALAKLTVPTVVIHGVQDPLVPVENGRATAAAVPGAELVEIDGMGHDIPPGVWEPIVDAIARVASRATTNA